MRSVAIEARARQFGTDEVDTPIDIETNQIGRLRATGEISLRQYEAAVRYRTIVAIYDRLHLARGLPKAGDLNRGGGHDAEDPFFPADKERREAAEKEYADAVRRHDECERALQDANREDRHASYTVKAQVIADWRADYFVPALRVGLNHLAKALRLPVNDDGRRLDKIHELADVQSV